MGGRAKFFLWSLVLPTILFASQSPIDFRYANTNRAALIGVPEGERKPIVTTEGSVTVSASGESLSFSLARGKTLSIDIPDSQTLVQGRLPAVVTQAQLPSGATLTLTSFTAPLDPPIDFTRIDVANAPLTLTSSVTYSEVAGAAENAFFNSAGEPLYRFGSLSNGVKFQSPAFLSTHDYHVGQYFPYPNYWNEPPANKADSAFLGEAYGWGGAAIHHRFPVAASQSYLVVLGFREDYYDQPGRRLLDVSLENQLVSTVDPIAEAPKNVAFVRGYWATDGGDGLLDVQVKANSKSPDNNAFLSAIWIFDASQAKAIDLNEVLLGKDDAIAKYFVACGNVKERKASLDIAFSPKAGEIQTAWIQRPWSKLSATPLIAPGVAFAKFQGFWRGFFAEGAQLNIPDKTVEDFYYASLANIKLMEDVRDGFHVLQPGGTVYRGFWFRDGSYMANALTDTGHFDDAKQALEYFLHLQPADGGWNMPQTQWDSLGQAPWGLVHYWEITRDPNWLQAIYPALKKDVQWIAQARSTTKKDGVDSLHYGLLPKGFGDGGMQYDYCYHQDVWALYGEELASEAASALGEAADAAWIDAEREDFKADLDQSIAKSFILEKDGLGYIPPIPGNASDVSFGEFLAALGPTKVLLDNPYMDKTIQWLEAHEAEGLPIGIGWLANGVWPYASADLAKGYLYKNEVDKADAMFYAIMNHAAPTRGWIEEIDLATHKGSGDMPHGWAAANHILLLRQMLLREQGDTLYVAQGIPRGWLNADQPVEFDRAPTTLGTVSLQMKPAGSAVQARLSVSQAMKAVVFNRSASRLPIRSVECDRATSCGLVDDTARVVLLPGDNLVTLKY